MIRPVDAAHQLKEMTLEARDQGGGLLGTIALHPPSALPKAVHMIGPGFTPGAGTTGTVKTTQELTQLSDPKADLLKSLLAQHALVSIETADGRWVRDIYLPSSGVQEGRMIRIHSSAAYASMVYYRDVPVNVTKNQTRFFMFIKGRWIGDTENDSTLQYAANTWSAILPGPWVIPGLSLKILADDLSGEIKDLKIGAPTELLLHTIDIGMLTSPRGRFEFANNPQAHREYFQTVPISRMIVSQYAPLFLPEVMLPDGTLLKLSAPTVGGWHDGTMRQSIGKELVSHGIDNANYGLNSTAGSGEDTHPYVAAQVTAHNSRGVYSNGTVVHGGSGGGGVVTLEDSIGNEFSHELGHNFNLGHYEGGFAGSVHRNAGEINSAWGWDGDKGRLIPNFGNDLNNSTTCLEGQCQAPFNGYSFGLDAMAGGAPFSAFNNFTFYTPYSASIIQGFFESKAVFDSTSPTGFKKWNATTLRMEPYAYTVLRGTVVKAAIGDLNVTSLQNLFTQYDGVKVNMADGFWTREFSVPLASAENKGRYVWIDHQAAYSSTMNINGVTVQLARGFKRVYISDGQKWVENPETALYVERIPQAFGVPVTTLIGYYDPQGNLPTYLYPALYGSYGMVYPDDAKNISTQDCKLQVQTVNQTLQFKLNKSRVLATVMNKFHVNVPSASQPSSFKVVCGDQVLAQKDIAATPAGLIHTMNGRSLTPNATVKLPSCVATPRFEAEVSKTVIMQCQNGTPGDLVTMPGSDCVNAWFDASGQLTCQGIAGDLGSDPKLTVTNQEGYSNRVTVPLTVGENILLPVPPTINALHTNSKKVTGNCLAGYLVNVSVCTTSVVCDVNYTYNCDISNLPLTAGEVVSATQTSPSN